MPLNIDVDQSTSDALNQGVEVGSAIRLPFEVPYFFVVNGDKRVAQVGGAAYFGGWAVDRDDLHTAGQCWDPPIVEAPSYCYSSDFYTKNGKTIPVYMTRSMIVALIGTRVSWAINAADGQARRFKDYVPGSRRHMQLLVYVADKTPEKKLTPWAPAVLTASGYQVGNLIKGLQDWKSAVEKILRAEKSPATPWMFYTSIGTFGDDFKQEMVGPTGAQSPITPVSVQVPKTLSAELLEKLYVGRETARSMADLKAESADWLNAWKNLPGAGQPDAGTTPAGPAVNSYTPPQPPAWTGGEEEGIPF